ncbi:MAG: acyltransferase [Lachnospiraceae bacterium]|nr:acyltransferase [Lachnospiraceae bacterium]
MEGEKGRIVQLDFAKVIAFIWIVLCWHLVNYLPYDYAIKSIVYNDYGHCITRTMLSLFVFLSGLFLSKYTFSLKTDVYEFYKKRLTRFYILYIVACISIYFSGDFIPSLKQLALTMLGLSGIVSPAVGTMWFMSMMIFFYVITPVLYDVSKKLRLYRSAMVLCILFIIHIMGFFDERYILYFPCYVVGICLGNSIIRMIESLKVYGIVISIIWVMLILLKWEHLSVIFGVTTIIYLTSVCIRIIKIEAMTQAIKIGSYVILCGYLFHRQIIYIFHRQMHLALYWMPLFILVLSYGIQRSYDLLFLKIQTVCLLNSKHE